MLSTILKHRFSFHVFRSSRFKFSMSSSFYGQELQRALKEQGTAIQNFKIVDNGSLQASARVKLLEGNLIGITLTARGYKIDTDETQVYETVEALLQSISPLYSQKRSEALFEALKRLS